MSRRQIRLRIGDTVLVVTEDPDDPCFQEYKRIQDRVVETHRLDEEEVQVLESLLATCGKWIDTWEGQGKSVKAVKWRKLRRAVAAARSAS